MTDKSLFSILFFLPWWDFVVSTESTSGQDSPVITQEQTSTCLYAHREKWAMAVSLPVTCPNSAYTLKYSLLCLNAQQQ